MPVVMSREEVLSAFAQILNDVAGTDTTDLDEAANLTRDLRIDSLTLVELVVAAEDKFGVLIPDEALDRLVTVGDVVTYIAEASVEATRTDVAPVDI